MSSDTQLSPQRVTRFSLTIAFEELYTRDDAQLHASANAIGAVASEIAALIATDLSLQNLLKVENLTLNIIAPARPRSR
jgi:hypothetical protein